MSTAKRTEGLRAGGEVWWCLCCVFVVPVTLSLWGQSHSRYKPMEILSWLQRSGMAPEGSSWFTVVFFTLQLKLLGPGTLCFCKASEPDVIQQEGLVWSCWDFSF